MHKFNGIGLGEKTYHFGSVQGNMMKKYRFMCLWILRKCEKINSISEFRYGLIPRTATIMAGQRALPQKYAFNVNVGFP